MFKKTILFTAKRPQAKVDLEIELQQIASKYPFVPKIHKVEKFADRYEVTMDKIDNMCLADMYSDDPKEIPKRIWAQIHAILTILYECEGIEYIDITGYNFIEKDNKVYIIDFGDAQYKSGHINWFLKEFLAGQYEWNPDFA
jgi:RIO-like serine/threonine protein kinase